MQSLLAIFIWPDAIPDVVFWIIFILIPVGLISLGANPLVSLIQLPFLVGAVAFVAWRMARRRRRKGWWDYLDTLAVVGVAAVTYVIVVPATNLLLFWLWS